MKKISIGILVHVDAGKTSLREALLFTTGKFKEKGLVQYVPALFYYEQESCFEQPEQPQPQEDFPDFLSL